MALSSHVGNDKCYEEFGLHFKWVSEYKRKILGKSNEAYRELSFDLLKSWPCKDGRELRGMLKYHVLFAKLSFILYLQRSGPMNTTC